MKSILLLCGVLSSLLAAHGQSTLLPGTALLFKQVKSRLSNEEKNQLFRQSGLLLSKDKKHFTGDGADEEDTISTAVYPVDMNGDGIEEVFIIEGSAALFGNTGANLILFVKDKNGDYAANLGFPAIDAAALPSRHAGYPDLLMGVPGMQIPVWRWDGRRYNYYKSVADEVAGKFKTTSMEMMSAAYTAGIKGK